MRQNTHVVCDTTIQGRIYLCGPRSPPPPFFVIKGEGSSFTSLLPIFHTHFYNFFLYFYSIILLCYFCLLREEEQDFFFWEGGHISHLFDLESELYLHIRLSISRKRRRKTSFRCRFRYYIKAESLSAML